MRLFEPFVSSEIPALLGKLIDKTRRLTVQSTEKFVPPTSMMLATQLAESQRTSYASSLPRGLAADTLRCFSCADSPFSYFWTAS